MELDPFDVSQAIDGSAPIGPVPRNVRDFGFRFPTEVLSPGDLILTAHPTAKIGGVIREFQSDMFGAAAARWTHAAVHVKDGIIVEATPRLGIRRGHVHEYTGKHHVAVRRPHRLDPTQRRELALDAALELGMAYDPWMILTFISARLRRDERQRKHTICPQLYFDSYLKACDRAIAGCAIDRPVTPAHLAASPDLVPVPLHWVRLPPL